MSAPVRNTLVFFRPEMSIREGIEKATSRMREIEKAIHQDPGIVYAAGQQKNIEKTNLAFQNFINLHPKWLDKKVSEVDQPTFQLLDQWDNMLIKIEQGSLDPEIIKNIPSIINRPHISDVSPRYIVLSPNHPSNIKIDLSGHFPQAGRNEQPPVLLTNEMEFSPSTYIKKQLSFSIPSSHFPPDTSLVTFIVQIPYSVKKPRCHGALPQREVDRCSHYKFSIRVLPEIPGKITVVYRRMVEIPEERSKISDHFVQKSHQEKRDIKRIYTATPTDGWHVKIGSAEPHLERSRLYQLTKSVETADGVSYTVITRYSKADRQQCGSLRFRISFIEERTQRQIQEISEDLHLTWGERHIIPRSKGEAKIFFTPPSGARSEIVVGEKKGVVSVKKEGDDIGIQIDSGEAAVDRLRAKL